MQYWCGKCKKLVNDVKIPKCECGNIYELKYSYSKDLQHITHELNTLPISHWKYHEFMPINYHNRNIIIMGEGHTPILNMSKLNKDVFFKCEYVNPTGSFKDRASALEISLAEGKDEIVVATTGNMGASLASYSAYVGIPLKVFIPENIADNKIEYMKACGAEIIKVKGTYIEANDAAEKYYLEHPNSYLAGDYGIRVEGTKSIGFEIIEQLNYEVPDYIFIPIGNGVLLWGIYKAFKDWKEMGFINKYPKFIGVKSKNPETTIASAIACKTANADYMIHLICEEIIEVSDEEIRFAQESLGLLGFYVELGGAVAFAGFFTNPELFNGTKVFILTGSGMKGD